MLEHTHFVGGKYLKSALALSDVFYSVYFPRQGCAVIWSDLRV